MWHYGLVSYIRLSYLLLYVDMKENGSKTRWKVMEWLKWIFPKWSLFLDPSTSLTALNSLHIIRAEDHHLP